MTRSARTRAARTAEVSWSDLRPEGPAEPDVALGGVAAVGDPVADHERALDPQAEREAAVAVGVDAAGDEHPRVDHAAARDLDPALRAADPARLAPGAGPGQLSRA